MYLKQLEMQGFKSFPEKIRLKFGKGITAVVGPNGSGKSNVADAVRWVLGETGSKSLRGQKMEDVIFAGTENRRPLGFAEVSLVMDNSDGRLNMEYEEITVTRRLFRSGESTYMINGTVCRRKDILELFMDTGIGKEGYSIIGQGRINEILSVRSEDRRALFEEAAGIVKFRNRRNEAQKKLEAEHSNLLRAEDIIKETGARLAPLEKAAEKAKTYLELAEQLKKTDISLFVIDAEKYREQSEKLESSLETVISQLDETKAALEKAENERESKKQNSEKLNEEIEALNGRITEFKVSCSEKMNEISLINSENEHMRQDITRLNKEAEASLLLSEEKKSSAEAKNSSIILKKDILAKTEEKLKSCEEEYDSLRSALENREQQFSSRSKNLIESMEKIAAKKEEIAKITQLSESASVELEKIEKERLINDGLSNEKKTLIEALENKLKEAENFQTSLDGEYKKLMSLSADLENDKNVLDKEARQTSAELSDCQSKIKIYTGLENSYEGYYNGVKAVLKRRGKELSGICGAVGELIRVEKKYELAVETVLGAALQNIITEDESSAEAAIDFLKKTKSGRVTFMPLTASPPKAYSPKPEIIAAKGFIGMADSLIGFDEKYRGIFNNLLGRTVVVDTMENASSLARRIRYSNRIVTLTGEVYNTGGSITGGFQAKKSAGLLSRRTELEAFKAKARKTEDRFVKITSELEKTSFNLNSIKRDIEKNRTDFNDKSIAISSLKARLRAEKQALDDITFRSSQRQAEFETISQRAELSKERLETVLEELKKLEAFTEGLNKSLDNSMNENKDLRESLDNKYKELSGFRVETERLKTELSGDISQAESLKTEGENLKLEAEKAKTAVCKLNADIDKVSGEIAAKTKEAEALGLKVEELTEEYRNKLRERSGLNDVIHRAEIHIKDFNDTLISLNSEKTKLEERLVSVKEKNRILFDTMWETYEITYPEAMNAPRSDKTPAELHKQASELKAKIKALGNINTSAPEEFRETKARYEFLMEQKEDIEKAEKDLVQITEKLEELMKERFSEQFKIINKNFNAVFKEMFGGGYADIKLTDKDDVLNSGIEINAQPPGKKLQSMLLLSGGENALTAMALLFAILKMKPSPFCILDEIEAALDDSNVSRYAKYLKKLSGTTQFVVITHRKGTMEEADSLYGITMQEKGVSKMISVSLKEASETLTE